MHHKHFTIVQIATIVAAVIVVSIMSYNAVLGFVGGIPKVNLPNIEKLVTSSLKEPDQNVSTPEPLRAKDDAKNAKLTIAGVIKFTNLQRFNNGLPELKENTSLDQSADKKLKDMFSKQYFEHISPDGRGVEDLAKDVQYAYIAIGENLALGNFSNDQSLVQAWMDSPGHRANILNKKYTEIGIAVGKGMYEGHTTWLAVQHFGMPLSACPSPNETIKKNVESLRAQIDTVQQQLEAKKSDIDNSSQKYGDQYNQKIDQYNDMVNQYNSMVNVLKTKINQYNSQIDAFNRCAVR